jgi:tetratricopeptide (TPR) repeat protein
MRYLFIALFLVCIFSITCAAEQDYSEPMDKGIELLTKGEYDSAAAKFREAIKEREDPEAYMLLGTTLNRAGEYSRALEALNRARELKTKSAAVLFEIGRSNLGLGKYKEAYEAFSQDISNNPWRDTSYLLAGECLYHLGEYREAVEYFKDAVSREISYLPQAQHYIGLCQVRLKEYREAGESFKRAARVARERKIAGIPLPAIIQRQIEAAEEAARRAMIIPRDWYASISMGFEYTDNVLSLSKDALLPADISDRRDESAFFVAQAGHRLYKDPSHELWAMGTVYANHYFDLDEFDVQQYSPQLEYLYTPDSVWRLRSTLFFTHYKVDEEESSNSLTFSQGVTRSWHNHMSTSFDYTVTLIEFEGETDPDEDRDGNFHSIRGYQSFQFAPYNTILNVGARYGWNNTQGSQFDSDSYSVFGSLGHDFVWDSRIRYDLTYTRTKFDNLSSRADPAFSFNREDDSFSPSVAWFKRFTRNWSTSFVFSYLDNDSNIAVYDFDKYTLSAAVTYTF